MDYGGITRLKYIIPLKNNTPTATTNTPIVKIAPILISPLSLLNIFIQILLHVKLIFDKLKEFQDGKGLSVNDHSSVRNGFKAENLSFFVSCWLPKARNFIRLAFDFTVNGTRRSRNGSSAAPHASQARSNRRCGVL